MPHTFQRITTPSDEAEETKATEEANKMKCPINAMVSDIAMDEAKKMLFSWSQAPPLSDVRGQSPIFFTKVFDLSLIKNHSNFIQN